MITINKQLDMTPGAIPVVIHRSQYDSDFSIVFTLFARMGSFTIASGTTAKVRGTKKSGTGYSADATIDVSAKTVTVTGDQQMTVASGQNIFEIVLLNGTSELCSANFILDVERAALDMDTITDDTVARELDNLEQFVEEAESAATRAEQAAASFATDTTLTISGKPADAKAVGDAIANEDKKALAAFATDIASGSIASFLDGADDIPMKDVLVHVDPVQDLHGYDSPWPAGGGKNFLNDSVKDVGTFNGVTVSQNSKGQFVLNGTATSNNNVKVGVATLPAGSYIFSGMKSTGSSSTFFLNLEPRWDGISNQNLYSGEYSGTSNAERTYTAKIYYRSGQSFSNTIFEPMLRKSTDSADFEPYSNICPITGWTGCVISHSGADMTNPTTYSIAFPTEAGTVYGGTLDVTSGVLTVDRAKVSLSNTSDIYRNSAKQYYIGRPGLPGIKAPSVIEASVLSNQFKPSPLTSKDGIVFLNAGGDIRFNTTAEYASVAEMIAALGTLEFCYPLATPIEYTLTPQEITSLLGTNNVWADTGDSEVEYRADTKLYIDKKITEAVSALS